MDENVYKIEGTKEWTFKESSYILSETDEHGVITYVNDTFCHIANYKREELIGQPHNIVRHPDMPRAAFKMLWDAIQSKGFWEGIVKNKRSDGEFYWVFATVIRQMRDGKAHYFSLRTKPTKSDVQKAEALYKTLD